MVGGLSGLNIAAGIAGLTALIAGLWGDLMPRRKALPNEAQLTLESLRGASLTGADLTSTSLQVGTVPQIESRYDFDGRYLTVTGSVSEEELAYLIQRFHSVRVIRGSHRKKATANTPRKKPVGTKISSGLSASEKLQPDTA